MTTFSHLPFERYVDRAREGEIAFWRILLGAVLITLVWAASTGLAIGFGMKLSGMLGLLRGPARGDAEASWQIVEGFFETPAGIACTLLSFVGMIVGVFLAVRLLQRRPFATVLGADGRLSWRDLTRGFAAALIASGLAEIAFYFVDPSLRRSDMSVAAWLSWLLPLVLLLFIQIAAEELAFRGYLMQSLAARFRSPVVWGLLPGLLFTLLHWNSDSLAAMNGSQLVTIAAFASVAALLVYLTGNLGAAMGTHLGMNLFSILIVSHMGWLNGGALFVSRPMEAPGWTTAESAWLALINLGSFAIVLLLLLDRRSPLKVTGAAATSRGGPRPEAGESPAGGAAG